MDLGAAPGHLPSAGAWNRTMIYFDDAATSCPKGSCLA